MTKANRWKGTLQYLRATWKSRLSRRLAFWVFLGILLIESVILVPSVHRREQELLHQLRAIALGKVTWILVTYPSMSGPELVDRLADLQQRNPLILGGAVYHASGEQIGQFGDSPGRAPGALEATGPRRTGNYYDDVVWSGARMMTPYTILVRLDASRVQPELLAYIGRIIGLVLIISLFLTLTVWVAVDFIVISPILRLRQDLLAAGDSIYRDETPPAFFTGSLKRQDELGDVISAFDQMFVQISDAVVARKRVEEALQKSLNALDQELEKGRAMQRNFLPRQLLQTPGWEIAGSMSPARQVAGDFYDVFELPCRNLGLVIGDVCDKGVSAALFMGLFRSLIRIFSSPSGLDLGHLKNPSLNEAYGETSIDRVRTTALGAVRLTNDYIAKLHGDEGIFATLFFGVLSLDCGELAYINGGHEAPLILDSAGRTKSSLPASGSVVGMLAGSQFATNKAHLLPGDTLLGYTDGVTEARNAAEELFGRERLSQILQSPISSPQVLVEKITGDVSAFMGYAEQTDDITLLAIKRA